MKIYLFKRRQAVYLFFLLIFLFLLPNFLHIHLDKLSDTKADWDHFDPKLAGQVKSIDALLALADNKAQADGVNTVGDKYLSVLDSLVRYRFYHGYSYYALDENWIAVFSGLLIKKDLSAIVRPDDILKYPMAACSQQSIVMMEALKRKGLTYRKVEFTGHYALEANVNGKWYYLDPNTEPDFSRVARSSFDSIYHNHLLSGMYKGRTDSVQKEEGLVFVKYGVPNAMPAPNASAFHVFTGWASRVLWLLPLCAILFLWKRKNLSNEKRQQAVSVSKKQHYQL